MSRAPHAKSPAHPGGLAISRAPTALLTGWGCYSLVAKTAGWRRDAGTEEVNGGNMPSTDMPWVTRAKWPAL
ncbi:hypothetical protein ACMU_15030 [Actibacterium mucosum KCTC 23349]|uniref:Uncharacterized protein n=1 Tax=Actibacterium mucosum KCTC 23349 TaxID=1454373 RepID=A0A037ZHP8_9RHOB|nr:hypothetical protein ACMU_15030 [Actibacterium mucosum KCTC 23349]